LANKKDFRQASDAASFVFVAGIVYSNVRPDVQAAILETAIDSNVALYLKLGFKVVGGLPKGGPHFWSMLYEN
jgi:hypothetical protein